MFAKKWFVWGLCRFFLKIILQALITLGLHKRAILQIHKVYLVLKF